MIWLMQILKVYKRRTASDKALRDTAFKIANNLKHDGYQRSLASMVYKSLINLPLLTQE